ncbi:MAG: OsmC family protein [Nitrosopumilus sp.]|nr:OsmC family protein [Nitrosopumilus sp.]
MLSNQRLKEISIFKDCSRWESVNPGYEGINIKFKIKSDASKETLQELIKLAKNVSPVANTISKPTPIKIELVR